MSELPISPRLDPSIELWDAIATVRDASPRLPGDADTDLVVAAIMPIVERHAKRSQAAELRRLARDIGNRSYTATPQWVRVQQELGARADELDDGQP